LNSPNESIIELTTIDQWVQAFPVLNRAYISRFTSRDEEGRISTICITYQ